MAKWAHIDVLENGPAYIKSNCNKLAVLSAYSLGDSYATVTAAILADVAMTSADFTFSTTGTSPNLSRALTSASGKQDASANATGTTSHFAYVDTVNSKVLWVTPENTGQSVTTGNPVTFPSLTYTSNQPT